MLKARKWLVLAAALAGMTLGWGATASTGQTKKATGPRTQAEARQARLERMKQQFQLPAQRRAAGARFKQMRAKMIGQALAKGKKVFAPVPLEEFDPLASPNFFWPLSGPNAGPLADPGPYAAAAAGQMPPMPGETPHYFGPWPNYANSPLPRGGIAAINLVSGGAGYANPVVTIADLYGTGSGATATASFDAVTGAITGFTVLTAGQDYSAPAVFVSDATNPAATGADALPVLGQPFTGGLRKFMDALALTDPAAPNGLGQFMPVAVPDQTTYPGSDYYEIELGQYTEKLHTDLDATLLRGYRQTNAPAPLNTFHYLGPLIVAKRGVPVRIKFTNSLPTGAGGDLFIPVDTTMMGAGMAPDGSMYSQNRATIHNHGAFVPWISDGTPHQWTTPAGDPATQKMGVSVYNVPDMINPGKSAVQGELTFFYPNDQSARLMFYHDHAWGITRLNVYAGEAAGYLITDQVEDDLIKGTNTSGVNPNNRRLLPDIGVPLIIQDKSFVDPLTIGYQDPTWKWGSMPGMPMLGDLWMPHVYMPNQNPADLSGMNAFGRWHYGPWFWPPVTVPMGPIANPYYDGGVTPWEYKDIPGVPHPSMAMEAFMDTPMVNGTVYPYMAVEPKLYRLRVLNVCNDRFVNLQIYKADGTVVTPDGRTNTEVKMVPAVATPGFPADWPVDGREGGVPDPATAGPSWIQIGTEGGFLPSPVVLPNQPVDWNMDQTNFDFGNVSSHSLLLGPAERADVLVDFSAFAGQTLILYNDAPAPFPAIDPRYDYHTGSPDNTAIGGAPPTLPGYGPNTRTIMQIRVAPSTADPNALTADLAGLQEVFSSLGGSKPSVFTASQDPILVPEARYNAAYGGSFPADPYVRIFEAAKTFRTLSGALMTLPLEPKAIQDEQGEAFDITYGRMSGFLGLQLPATAGQQQFTLYPYVAPPVELVGVSAVPLSEPLPGDGTQLWKVTHNGVDTHTLHFHLYNVQLINRVAWDNAVRVPDDNELGWKETVRVNPLQDTIVALRPVAPVVPFDVPNSIRLIDPSMPADAVLPGGPGGYKDPLGNPVTVTNHLVNFGWEYVLHCHLLGHEEMDMMHAQAVVVPPNAPTALAAVRGAQGINLTWADNSVTETGFTVERSLDSTFATGVTSISLGPDVTSYTDVFPESNLAIGYRVSAVNVVGDTQTPGMPVMTAASGYSFASVPAAPVAAAPSNLTLQLRSNPTSVRLRWLDNATNETGFVIERAPTGGTFAQIATFPALPGTGQQGNYTDATVLPGVIYDYRVAAANGALLSAYTNVATIAIPGAPAIPLAPAGVNAVGIRWSNTRSRITVNWTDASNNETGFQIQIATDNLFTRNLVTGTTGANATNWQSGNLRRGVAYWVRVRSANGTSFSAWVNATPFPVITP